MISVTSNNKKEKKYIRIGEKQIHACTSIDETGGKKLGSSITVLHYTMSCLSAQQTQL